MAKFTIAAKWRALDGHLHGLSQPSLLGHVRVQGAGDRDCAKLDAWLSDRLPVRQLPPVQGAPAEALLRRFFFWIGEVQRHARLAVSPQLHLLDVSSADDREGAVFEVAQPNRATPATLATMRWLEATANQLLAPAGLPSRQADEGLQALLQELKPRAEPGYNQLHLLLAAYRLGLLVHPLAGRLLRVGTGSRSRLLESTLTDRTSGLSVSVAQNKWLTTRVLKAIGLPATENDRVASADEAVALAHRLGWPVVVKPADKDQGLGVAAHLASDEAVREAFAAARAASPHVLVERHVHGFGHRLTVHDGELIAVLKRIPGGVHGDGRHGVAELVAQQLASAEVRRELNMGRVHLDAEALGLLAERGLDPESVPAAGEFVLLRRRDNLSAGGRFEFVDPASVHPDNLLAAQRAAKALYLDLAGIDFLSPDITQSWHSNGAAICEVNARPQFGPGPAGDNFDRVLRRLLGEPLQIPVHLYLCRGPDEPGLRDTLRALADRLGVQAISQRDGVWLLNTMLGGRRSSGWLNARSALADRDVPSLLMALSPTEVIARGLPLPRIDSLHVSADHESDWPADERAALPQALRWCHCAPTAVAGATAVPASLEKRLRP